MFGAIICYTRPKLCKHKDWVGQRRQWTGLTGLHKYSINISSCGLRKPLSLHYLLFQPILPLPFPVLLLPFPLPFPFSSSTRGSRGTLLAASSHPPPLPSPSTIRGSLGIRLSPLHSRHKNSLRGMSGAREVQWLNKYLYGFLCGQTTQGLLQVLLKRGTQDERTINNSIMVYCLWVFSAIWSFVVTKLKHLLRPLSHRCSWLCQLIYWTISKESTLMVGSLRTSRWGMEAIDEKVQVLRHFAGVCKYL